MKQYPVYYFDLPTTIRGFARKTADGYVVVLNSRLSLSAQRETYRHEAEHIDSGDFESEDPADRIEAERHLR